MPDVPSNANLNPEQSAALAVNEVRLPAKGNSFRGPLRYEIETSSPTLEAGTMFSVTVRIVNPYDIPVTLLAVETELPIEFWEPYGFRAPRTFMQKLKAIFWSEFDAITQKVSAVQVEKDTEGPGTGSMKDLSRPLQMTNGAEPLILQPGNAALNAFTLKTRKRVFFTPSTYNLHVQLKYEMDGKVNHDAVKTQLNIKAPILALVWGAVPGAIVGSILKSVNVENISWSTVQSPEFIFGAVLSAVTGILLALVLVVSFARKKDSQPFVSVEDFFGGFFVGFLAGYGGYSLLDKVISQRHS